MIGPQKFDFELIGLNASKEILFFLQRFELFLPNLSFSSRISSFLSFFFLLFQSFFLSFFSFFFQKSSPPSFLSFFHLSLFFLNSPIPSPSLSFSSLQSPPFIFPQKGWKSGSGAGGWGWAHHWTTILMLHLLQHASGCWRGDHLYEEPIGSSVRRSSHPGREASPLGPGLGYGLAWWAWIWFGGFRSKVWYFDLDFKGFGLDLGLWALIYPVLESFRFLEFKFRRILGSFCIQRSYFFIIGLPLRAVDWQRLQFAPWFFENWIFEINFQKSNMQKNTLNNVPDLQALLGPSVSGVQTQEVECHILLRYL